MRLSVPTIPLSSTHGHILSPAEAIECVVAFLKPGNVTALTGAGVSVDSGIKAYRGEDGRYLNANYKSVPCLFSFISACNDGVDLCLYVPSSIPLESGSRRVPFSMISS